MRFRERIALWLYPEDKRAQNIRSLGEKLKDEREECKMWRDRALDAEKGIVEIILATKKTVSKHDRAHATTLNWKFQTLTSYDSA